MWFTVHIRPSVCYSLFFNLDNQKTLKPIIKSWGDGSHCTRFQSFGILLCDFMLFNVEYPLVTWLIMIVRVIKIVKFNTWWIPVFMCKIQSDW